MTETGYLPPSNGFWTAEWKYDTHPWPKEVPRTPSAFKVGDSVA